MDLDYGNNDVVKSVIENKNHTIRDIDIIMEHRIPEDNPTRLIACLSMDAVSKTEQKIKTAKNT